MKFVEWNGEVKNMTEWAEYLGMSTQAFAKRYKRFNGDMDKIASIPLKKENVYRFNGKRITLEEIAEMNGTVSHKTIGAWLRSEDITIEDAIKRKNRRMRRSFKGKNRKPEFCCEPDCDKCPYPDCKWG